MKQILIRTPRLADGMASLDAPDVGSLCQCDLIADAELRHRTYRLPLRKPHGGFVLLQAPL